MKMYFGFTVAGDRSTIETARGVVRVLEDLGHEVLTRHLVSDNAWEADRLISAQDVYRRDMAWLELCDIFIAEVSGSSFGLGFETGYLLGATNKKVILLYRRELEKKVSLLVTGNTHPNCTLAPYATIAEAEEFRCRPPRNRIPSIKNRPARNFVILAAEHLICNADFFNSAMPKERYDP
jgi:2'-deoxynucleoside 5'-phosphate N-hydrolase